MRLIVLALLLTATPALAQPTRDVDATSTVTGPTVVSQRFTSATEDQIATSFNSVSFPTGGNCEGSAHATARRKVVMVGAHALAEDGGGISYNGARATSTNTLLLVSPSL